MKEQTKTNILKLKADFRSNMNGVASASMRNAGMKYKLIFGIELPRLKEIASHFEPDHELAQELWKEDIRESKIVATMLQPIDTFFPEIADIWAESITTYELCGIASLNLFRRLPYASEKAFEWIASDSSIIQSCGYHTILHLIRQNTLSERSTDELIDQSLTTISTAGNAAPLKKVAWNTLLALADKGKEQTMLITDAMKSAGFDEKDELKSYLEMLFI